MSRIIQNNGINENTFNNIFESDKFKLRSDCRSNKESLLYMIESFTTLDDNEAKELIKAFPIFGFKNNSFYASNDGLTYSFNRLDQISNFYSKQELLSKERYGHCCDKSMELVNSLAEDCKILVGYNHYTEKKLVHAVVELITSSGPIIIDYTKNLVMKKKEYFDLTEFELINTVTKQNLKQDLPILAETEFIPIKMYLIYRDELIKDLKKNDKILGLKQV